MNPRIYLDTSKNQLLIIKHNPMHPTIKFTADNGKVRYKVLAKDIVSGIINDRLIYVGDL